MIRRAQRGDRAAFESIYRLHCRRVYALCLRAVRNPAEAEDLTQEAFLLVFRKIHLFRCESAFSTWLYRLALNVVLMDMRKKKVRPAPLEGARKREGDGRGEEEQFGSPDLSLTTLVDRFHLERAVDQLAPTWKMVFVLHDVQGYKHREIAGMMDSTVSTSKARLHKARLRLRQLLVSGPNPLNYETAGRDKANSQPN